MPDNEVDVANIGRWNLADCMILSQVKRTVSEYVVFGSRHRDIALSRLGSVGAAGAVTAAYDP